MLVVVDQSVEGSDMSLSHITLQNSGAVRCASVCVCECMCARVCVCVRVRACVCDYVCFLKNEDENRRGETNRTHGMLVPYEIGCPRNGHAAFEPLHLAGNVHGRAAAALLS